MSIDSVADQSVHPLVRKGAAWAWRLLVLGVAVVFLLWVISHFLLIVVPVALAAMFAALLLPAVDALAARRVPRGGAVAIVLLGAIAGVGGILSFVVSQFITGAPALVEQVTASVDGVRNWLIQGPLHLSKEQIDHAGDALITTLQENQAKVTSGALSTAATVTEILTGALLVLFTLIFLLQGGRAIFRYVTKIFPSSVRDRVRDAGRAGFHSLTGYVRATCLVALVDAVGIGTGLAIMGVPLALPLASLVFLGAFIPLIGAVLTGGVAVIVALIAKGWVYALITLGLILAVQQLESHVLQPLVMGRAVAVHPLAVVLAIASGGLLAGIVGALLAVPVLAVLNSAMRVLLAPDPQAEQEQVAAELEPEGLTGDPPGAADPPR
ncbi:AI-2E family transporter [Mycolicibacterium diernhoferi]|uniref:AI-2E family transporter n=1 Tax=Mycolicibacterium diernhoferi TaxID=1801 RepID=A0A1Q4HHF2_9MYCO|nr:AI-2E family transporter [Mycolicibacterium diernhoferi]OJZ66915.1 AI-2E family transporter [Mycolicibacterium diernhoferi]OPE55347.1 AI-2E family transporter [Mycolicibacterium diernhoferi]PEG51947.1 AI-2E family transporter [Mycolicibacterium diernhoferi]QYL23107.1 AI-2E family transporter [Mycolicibacterium diernhoferi]